MKKLLALFLFILISCNMYAFAGRTKFDDLPYGNYTCVKDGETCDFYIYDNGSGGSGKACPELKKGVHPDVYFSQMGEFLASKYCRFTPTRVRKYECNYGKWQGTVYLDNGKVISASYSPDMPQRKMQEYYESSKCKPVPMKHR